MAFADATKKIDGQHAYLLRGGRVTRLDIPEVGFTIPGESSHRLLRGQQNTMAAHWTLEEAATIAHHILPWFDVYAAPECSEAPSCGGYYSGSPSYLYLSTRQCPPATFSALLHEIWHAAEAELSAEAIQIVSEAVNSGPHYAAEDYLSSVLERRARAAEHYAVCRLECGRLFDTEIDTSSPAAGIFSFVYSGGLALRRAIDGEISADALSPDLRARFQAIRSAEVAAKILAAKPKAPVDHIIHFVNRTLKIASDYISPPIAGACVLALIAIQHLPD